MNLECYLLPMPYCFMFGGIAVVLALMLYAGSFRHLFSLQPDWAERGNHAGPYC